MKQLFTLFVALLLSQFSLAQVGIGTTNPDASSILDITSNSAGVLIPRLTETEKNAIVTPAQGLLVYQTDNIEGFYYFDGLIWNYVATSSVNSWSRIGNSGTDPSLDFIGTTDANDLVIRTNNSERLRVNVNGNVGIGTTLNTARVYTEIDNTDATTDYGIRNVHNGTSNNTKYGIYNNVSADGTGGRYGVYSIARQDGSSTDNSFGTYNYLSSSTTGSSYGLLNYNFAFGTGTNYGISNTLNLTNATTNSTYLNYHFLNVSFSNNNSTLYGAYYDIDFNAGTRYGVFKTMTSSSAYNGDMYGDYNQIFGDGNGITYGNYNELSGNGSSAKYGLYNQFSNGEGEKTGLYNQMNNANNGISYGVRNEMNNNVSITPKYGYYNNLTGNMGTNFGVYSNMAQDATSTRSVYGVFSNISDVGMGTHYGAFHNVPGDGNYGVYSINTSSAGYAGYFNGRLTVTGTLEADNNIIPLTDATHNLGSLTNRWNTVYALNGTIQTSDIRLKRNIEGLQYGLDEVMQIKPISYYWKAETSSNDSRRIGLSAQNIKQVISEVVQKDTASDVLGVNYAELVPVLIKAIQEQQEQIEDLKQEVQSLKKKK